MQRIMLAENVEHVCRKWHDNSAGDWFSKHPDDKKLLAWAMEAYKHGKN